MLQETPTKLVVQKIEEEHGYTFRKKGHEKQWRFNKVVDSHIDNALDELKLPWSTDENTANIMDNIQEELIKGREEIADHQKIKMADRSEYSWGMVEAYKLDELEDDSVDEKMENAEKEAEKSATKRRKTKRSRVPSSSRQEGPEQKRKPTWEQQECSLVPARFPPQPPARQRL